MSAIGEPFKGLARFEDSDGDAALFFGRERDREIIAANLLASRLTVLYGESGVGKSSLLRAGIAHRLRSLPEPLVVVVFDAWQSDPVVALSRALADASGIEPGPTLADTLEACVAVAGGEVYVLLDQFDEYFLYHHDEAGPDTFAEQLPESIVRPGLRASFLIALREETLAKLDSFKGRIPNLFGNYLRLEHLDRAGARAAIVGPVEHVNAAAPPGDRVAIEPALVEAVLDEVTAGKLDLGHGGKGAVAPAPDGRIETPYLQLVMQRLWAAEAEAGSRTLRLETLRSLGGSEQIVREQLRGALEALPPEQQDLAAAVFNHLVTPSGTKIAHSAADLARYAHVEEDALAPVLSRLAADRILRPVAEGRYEIYHDVLADAALAWQRAHDVDRTLALERAAAGRRHRRLVLALAAAGVVVAAMAAVTVFALAQRSDARTEARKAHARELDATAVSLLQTDPGSGLRLAVRAARLEPSVQAENVLRQALLASRERAVLPANGVVRLARYSPDGRRILVAGDDGHARVYDAATHALLVTLVHGPAVRDAAFLPGGRLVVTAGADGTVRVWRHADGRLLRVLRHGAPLTALAVSGDGRLVAGVGGGRATVWWAVDGRRVVVVHSGRPLTDVALSANGRLAALAGLSRRALVVDTSTGRIVHRLDQGASVTSLAFGPGGRALVTTGKNGSARVWDPRSGRLRLELRAGSGQMLDAAFSPRGTNVATVGSDGIGRIWRVSSGALVSNLVGHTNPVTGVAFSPDGFFAVTTSSDRTARVWKVDTGDERAVLAGHAESVRAASFSPNGTSVLTASDDGTARIWDPTVQPKLRELTGGRGPDVRADYVPGGLVLVAGETGARLVRAADGRMTRRLAIGPVAASAVGPDGSSVALATGRRLTVHDLAEGAAPSIIPQPAGVQAIAYSPDGTMLAVAGADGLVRLWSLGGKPLRDLRGHRAAATDVAWSPDGSRLVSGSRDATARIWDVPSGANAHVLRGHTGPVNSVAFAPDGRSVLTAGRDGDARLWDAETGAQRQLLRWHFGSIADASFSPDGRWIVTAGPATAQLWRTGARDPLFPFGLGGHTRPLTSAVFADDSRTVLTAGRDGTVRTYRCLLCGRIPELLAQAPA